MGTNELPTWWQAFGPSNQPRTINKPVEQIGYLDRAAVSRLFDLGPRGDFLVADEIEFLQGDGHVRRLQASHTFTPRI